MLKDTQALVVSLLDAARVNIVENMHTHYPAPYIKGGEAWVSASGRSAAAFQVEVVGNKIRLVYRGDDVAPLASLEEGNKEPPTLAEAERWRTEKMSSGANDLPTAAGVVAGIRKRGGTWRNIHPQRWIYTPVIADTAEALKRQIPAIFAAEVRNLMVKK